MSTFPLSIVPRTIPGLRLWLDAADPSSITSSSNKVSQWRDKSGRGAHAAQATGANQPSTNTTTLAGKNVIAFSGTPVLMTFADNGILNIPVHIFIVAQRTNVSSGGEYYILGRDASGAPIGTFDIVTEGAGNVKTQLKDGSGVNQFATNAISSATPFIVHTKAVVGQNLTQDVNNGTPVTSGTNTVATTSDPSNTTGLGGRAANGLNGFVGFIAEILVYAADITASNELIIKRYITNKWGVAIA